MFRAPSQAKLPPLRMMTDDIPTNRDAIARHLDIAPRTLARYLADEQAPRPVMLALFWETRWGRGAADCEAANYGQAMHARAESLQRENAALRRQLAQLEQMRADGSANAPFFRVGL